MIRHRTEANTLPNAGRGRSLKVRDRGDLLPATYTDAKKSLATCQRVDECKTWSDKALALESYAKQMKDDSLLNMAIKIRDRAVQRGGQLLLEVKREKGRRTDRPSAGGHTKLKNAVKDAGLSPHQANTMMRVAEVPPAQFEKLVERDKPVTVKQLAEIGTKKAEKVKPKPYRNEWIDWTNAVQHLSALPACGLDVLASRDRYQIERLQRECAEALVNLNLWRLTVEKTRETEIADDVG
jgi:hypothetical protein